MSAPARVYLPHRAGLPPMRTYLRDAWAGREFAAELSRAQLRAKHHGTVFGRVWLVLNPVLMAAVYFVLVDIVRSGDHPEALFAHLVAGVFVFHCVSEATQRGARAVVDAGQLVRNSAFPRILLPLASVLTALRCFAATASVYLVVHGLAGLPFGPVMLWALPLGLLLAALAAGAAMLAATAQVYFRDLKDMLPHVLRLLLFASPVLYLPSEVPHTHAILLDVNPLGPLLVCFSDVLYLGLAPDPGRLGLAAAWSAGFLAAGLLMVVAREREFAVRI